MPKTPKDIKNTKDIVLRIFFPIISMGAIRYSCPIKLVTTYILPATEKRLLRKFPSDSFKTERLVCVETDGQTDSLRSKLILACQNCAAYKATESKSEIPILYL